MAGSGMMGMLLSLLVAEKSGFPMAEHAGGSELKTFTDQVTRQAMESIQQAVGAISAPPAEARGNGTPHPTVVAGAASSRLDGLDVRTDGA